jgi:hypothetical protein
MTEANIKITLSSLYLYPLSKLELDLANYSVGDVTFSEAYISWGRNAKYTTLNFSLEQNYVDNVVAIALV